MVLKRILIKNLVKNSECHYFRFEKKYYLFVFFIVFDRILDHYFDNKKLLRKVNRIIIK